MYAMGAVVTPASDRVKVPPLAPCTVTTCTSRKESAAVGEVRANTTNTAPNTNAQCILSQQQIAAKNLNTPSSMDAALSEAVSAKLAELEGKSSGTVGPLEALGTSGKFFSMQGVRGDGGGGC